MKDEEKIFITGAAGFIGFHLCKKLIENNFKIIGFDNVNNYYDVNLKNSRLKILSEKSEKSHGYFKFIKGDLNDFNKLKKTFEKFKPKIVFHMAAQAGVRHSIKNPLIYADSNLIGFTHILECCRKNAIENFIFASSSSVYGGNKTFPFTEKDKVNHPLSIYAATKKANELMAHSYSHLYGIPTIGVRFFTVYGPWGRPDMAPMIFTKAILDNHPIKIFNNGNMWRDFTYIDDVVNTLIRLIDKPAASNENFNKENPDPSSSWAPYKIFNLGNGQPVNILEFIKLLEIYIGKKAIKEFIPIQPGDVVKTLANNKEIVKYTNFAPKKKLNSGVEEFIHWYKSFYKYN